MVGEKEARNACGFCRKASLVDEVVESTLLIEALSWAGEDPSRLCALAWLLSADERACLCLPLDGEAPFP